MGKGNRRKKLDTKPLRSAPGQAPRPNPSAATSPKQLIQQSGSSQTSSPKASETSPRSLASGSAGAPAPAHTPDEPAPVQNLENAPVLELLPARSPLQIFISQQKLTPEQKLLEKEDLERLEASLVPTFEALSPKDKEAYQRASVNDKARFEGYKVIHEESLSHSRAATAQRLFTLRDALGVKDVDVHGLKLAAEEIEASSFDH